MNSTLITVFYSALLVTAPVVAGKRYVYGYESSEPLIVCLVRHHDGYKLYYTVSTRGRVSSWRDVGHAFQAEHQHNLSRMETKRLRWAIKAVRKKGSRVDHAESVIVSYDDGRQCVRRILAPTDVKAIHGIIGERFETKTTK